MSFTLISGTVRELETVKGKMNFALAGNTQKAAGAAAAGAALASSFFSSALLSQASNAKEMAIFFTFQLGDKTIQGVFNGLGIKNGDKVDVVIETSEQENDLCRAYAVRIPDKKQLWIAPLMEAGHIWEAKSIAKMGGLFIFPGMPFAIIIMSILCWIMGMTSQQIWEVVQHISLGFPIFCLILFSLLYLSFRGDALKGTQIIELLGFEDAKNVDLRTVNKQTKAAWAKKHPDKPFPANDAGFCIHYE